MIWAYQLLYIASAWKLCKCCYSVMCYNMYIFGKLAILSKLLIF